MAASTQVIQIIAIDKSTQFGIVIAGLEVIQGGFVVARLAAGAKRGTFLAGSDRRKCPVPLLGLYDIFTACATKISHSIGHFASSDCHNLARY